MSAVKPAMAFIFDSAAGIRIAADYAEALFELSANRSEFVSRLLSRPQPQDDRIVHGRYSRSLSEPFETAERNDALYQETLKALTQENIKAIRDHSMRKRRFRCRRSK